MGMALVLLIVLVMRLGKYLLKNRKKRRVLLKVIGALLLLITLLYLPIKILPDVVSEPTFNNSEDELNFEIKYKKFDDATMTLLRQLDEDSLNLEKHFRCVNMFQEYIDYSSTHVNVGPESFFDHYISQNIIDYYSGYKTSEDHNLKDIGYMFTALHYAHTGQKDVALQFDSVENKTMLYYDYVKAKVLLSERVYDHFDTIKSKLLSSAEKGNCDAETYNHLALTYYWWSKNEQLDSLVYDDAKAEFINPFFKRVVYFKNIDVVGYWKTVFGKKIESANIYGLVGAIIILLLWGWFLQKMDLFERERRKHILVTLGLSFISIFLVYPIHDIISEVFGYERPFTPISDFTYITITVGMVEEFVKILPVLIMLRFTKAINEPYDYILYASLSGLGFAFIENIGYFDLGNLDLIHTRGFLTSLAHMALSATVGYGLMLGRYRKNYNKYLVFGLFFIIASAFHGFYDFWLMNWWAINYWWASFIMFGILVHLWAYYANNTLNVSNFFNPKITFSKNRMTYFLMVLLVVITMVSYTINTSLFGSMHGKMMLGRVVGEFSFFLFYIPLTLSSITIVQGYIQPVTLPFSTIFRKRTIEDLRGLEIDLIVTKKFEIKAEFEDVANRLNSGGKLVKRQIVDDNLQSYIVQLDQPIGVEGLNADHIVVIPEWEEHKLNNKNRILVRLMGIPDTLEPNAAFLDDSDFEFIGRVFSKARLPSR